MSQLSYKTIQADRDRALRRALEASASADRREGVLAAFERNDGEALRRLFDGEAPLALVAFDTPGIQSYVFKAERPGDRQGGSYFVADFTRDPSETSGPENTRPAPSVYGILSALGIRSEAVIFAGAGSGLLLVAAGEARPVIAKVEAALRDLTKGDLRTAAASLAVWPVDLRPHTPEPGPGRKALAEWLAPARSASRYARTLAALYALLDRRRGELAALPVPVDGNTLIKDGVGGLCQSCGQRVGTKPRPRGDVVCELCQARGQEAGKHKRELDQASTTLDLFKEGEERPRLALLYADGSNFGAAFADLESPAQHRALSLAVDKAFAAAVEAGLEACGGPNHQKPIHGGDDLVMMLSARHVFDFTTAFVREVEERLSLSGNPLLRDAFQEASAPLRNAIDQFGVGVGIAIADETFPDRLLLRYAKELLRSAKRRIHASKDPADAGSTDTGSKSVRSAIDFMVLRSGNPLNGSVDQLRKSHFVRCATAPGSSEPTLHWTRRPYSLETLAPFIENTKALTETVPAAQLHAVLRTVHAGYHESLNFFRYQNARDLRGEGGRGWAAYRRRRETPLSKVHQLLWQERGEDAADTDFVDMMEIHDLFAPAQEGEA